LKINDLGYGTWNGVSSQVGAFGAPDNTSFRLAVQVRSNSPSGYVVGVRKGGTGATDTFDTVERSAGDTLFLVGRYDFNTSPNSVALWINPSPTTFGSTAPPAGFLSANTGIDGLTIDRFNFRQNTAASVPRAIQWDELRVGNSWGEVTPLPILLNVTQLGNGTFRFSFVSSSTQNGSVYASTNLIDWTLVGTPTQVEPGLYQFTDNTTGDHSKRFYQLRWP
jgi:hypothetical protein